jgi:hypothetical protein
MPLTRFHATKALGPSRPVRDISIICDEIFTPLSTASAHARITIDIESADLDKLSPDQVTALKENLTTLGVRGLERRVSHEPACRRGQPGAESRAAPSDMRPAASWCRPGPAAPSCRRLAA